MFPDPTVRWRPYPSIMDGIDRDPFVYAHDHLRGMLYLLVFGGKSGPRVFGVEIACYGYFAVEEMLYSVARHGDGSKSYDGGIYIKEAINSRLLQAMVDQHPLARSPTNPEGWVARHFLFVGYDFCFETIGFKEPRIRTFASEDEAHAWVVDT